MDVCWSCGTTIDGVEDPAFEPADEPAAPRAARTDPPGPVLALSVAFILPAAILNMTVGINVFVRGAMHPESGALMLLLMACEFLLTVAFFQWWYYQPPSVPAEIPAAGSEAEEEPAACEPAEPEADAIARRACLAAVLGVAFCPPVLNVYSFWLIFRHGLYARPSARLRWLVWLASIVNAAMCVVVALLFLMTGGLRLPCDVRRRGAAVPDDGRPAVAVRPFVIPWRLLAPGPTTAAFRGRRPGPPSGRGLRRGAAGAARSPAGSSGRCRR